MTRFFRLSGGGNDFLALVEPQDDPAPAQVRAWCRRGVSLGADGLFRLRRSPDGVEMIHFNADGGRAELCLNGTRCAVQLAHHLGWCEHEVDVVTDAGTVHGRRDDDATVSIEVPAPEGGSERVLTVDSDTVPGWSIRVGVPHFVVPWSRSLDTAPVDRLGPALRSHLDLGEEGANIDWVRFLAADRIEIRTYERGVEGETLACGTGVLAAVAIGLERGNVELPVRATTLGGFELTVEAAAPRSDAGRRWRFRGDARIVCEGHLRPGAIAGLEPARWSP